ncbi:MAG: hypothetical protein F6J94_13035 [Moorea sp. SIO1F2]|uniref:hypothetical protein n=1 Tax=unclassified Moorena TaxID=2683338 RepID=UPI0013B5F73A|nr:MULTISPECIES: hypothetical protein [unclassified Moorena]NEO00792.1 hypothetical protein [Moorena sp. SIO3I7]NEO06776.1 hypothetical protein [Moorena sp. SIO3I8]NET82813.1 hypothetical protein [Moorena sp. SIO1F2]
MLWLAMVLASIVIHLCFLWIVSMLLMGRFESSQPSQDLIAIDLIDIIPEDIAEQETSPEDPSTALIDQTIDLALTSPRSDRNLNHQTVSNSTIEATEGEVKPTPTEDILPVKDLAPPTDYQLTIPVPPPEPTTPITPVKPIPVIPTPLPSPLPLAPPIQPPASSIPEESASKDSFVAKMSNFGLTNPNRDIPDQLALPLPANKSEFSAKELNLTGIDLSEELVLKVVLLIDSNGKPELLADYIQVQQGKISSDQAQQLAQQVIRDWLFAPTDMAGQAVVQAYRFQLTISD